ncbi:hypothetical protein SAMN04488063_1353 [Halopelagius inordinatus]|uniref:Uncharacterized protein n=1 Tax=Halopelagius inordinatus TaxID=553467 RepID=A0A1I2NW55_9EURY|nr:hypothetical protein [Halopelagius inordinatus]SFG07783.1 hypothetical protein SAMN04488063_1353 [Halopelagius inordinatus]
MPSSNPTRRRVVAAGGLGLVASLAGCSLNRRTDGDDGGTSRQLALSLSRLDGSLRERYVADLTETEPAWDEAAFDAALDGEEFTTRHHTPFLARGDDDPTYARRNGTYYHLDSLVVGEETVAHPVLRLYEVESAERDEDAPEPVSLGSLPRVDERAVQIAHFAARARGNAGGVPRGLVERDGYVYRDEAAASESELLSPSGPSYVEHRRTVYEVDVARETFHETVYRPDVDAVATSDSEMETILRAELLDARLARDDLSSEERDVLIEARRREGYRESHPYSAAFESVLKKLGHWAYLDGDVEKDAGVESGLERRFLAYDDSYVTYTLRFVSGSDE